MKEKNQFADITVSKAISIAFQIALRKRRDHFEQWISISHRIGSKIPRSNLATRIQYTGNLDIIIREMENDLSNSISKQNPSLTEMFAFNSQTLLSELWVCVAYEIFRLLKDRNLENADSFLQLERHLRLIRIALDKGEVAQHRKQNVELDMITYPDRKDVFHYSSGNPLRSHILPTRIKTERGSLGWCVTDVISDRKKSSSYWLDRQEISDRILSLWTPGEHDKSLSS